jgi:hypothetical protein
MKRSISPFSLLARLKFRGERRTGMGNCPQTSESVDLGDVRMELTEAMIQDADDDVIEIMFSGDEDEWREIAAALRESDSDLATEVGMKIRAALKNAGR